MINLSGEVIGINTMKVAGTGGIGFAIPIDTAKIVLQQLKEKKRVDRPYLGLKMASIKELSHRSKRLPTNEGVLITNVAKGSPAGNAGLQPGDIIIEIDSQAIRSSYDVIRLIGYDIGRTHRFDVISKSGDRRSFHVTSVAASSF